MNITKNSLKLGIALLCCAAIACNTSKKAETVTPCKEVSYNGEIKEILLRTCTKCHDKKDPQKFVNFENVNKMIQSGEFQHEVIKKKKMPQDQPLTKEEYNAVKCWVEQGAKNN